MDFFFSNSLLYLNFQEVHLVFIFELSFNIFLNPHIFPNICFSYLIAVSWYFSPIHKEKKNLQKHSKYFIYCFIYCLQVIQKLNLKPSHILFFTVKGTRASSHPLLKPIKRITRGVCPRRFRVEKERERETNKQTLGVKPAISRPWWIFPYSRVTVTSANSRDIKTCFVS